MDLKQILEEIAKLPAEEQKIFAEYCAHFLKFSKVSHACYSVESDRISWMALIPPLVGNIADSYVKVLVSKQNNDEESMIR